MKESIEIVEARIYELQTLIGLLPNSKSFMAQARLIEAKKILELLKENKNAE